MTMQKFKHYLAVMFSTPHVSDVGGKHICTVPDVVPYASNLLLLKVLLMIRKM
jgi:hypothetical protein